tara:strand:+ start:4059 stop:4307 length:249 start_codon:yes stop_codon:yes gene_type:complete
MATYTMTCVLISGYTPATKLVINNIDQTEIDPLISAKKVLMFASPFAPDEQDIVEYATKKLYAAGLTPSTVQLQTIQFTLVH